jgi:hypothetical protein
MIMPAPIQATTRAMGENRFMLFPGFLEQNRASLNRHPSRGFCFVARSNRKSLQLFLISL